MADPKQVKVFDGTNWVDIKPDDPNLPISSTDNKVTLSDDDGTFQIETGDPKEVRVAVDAAGHVAVNGADSDSTLPRTNTMLEVVSDAISPFCLILDGTEAAGVYEGRTGIRQYGTVGNYEYCIDDTNGTYMFSGGSNSRSAILYGDANADILVKPGEYVRLTPEVRTNTITSKDAPATDAAIGLGANLVVSVGGTAWTRIGKDGTQCWSYSNPLSYINNYDMRVFGYAAGETEQQTVYGNFQGGYVLAQPSIKNVQPNRTYLQFSTPTVVPNPEYINEEETPGVPPTIDQAAEIAERGTKLSIQHYSASEINDSKGRPILSTTGFYCGTLNTSATDSYAFRTGNLASTDPDLGAFSYFAGGTATNYFRGTISQGMFEVPADDGTAETRLNKFRVYDNQYRTATGLATDRQAAGFGVTSQTFHVGTAGPINTLFSCGGESYAYVRSVDQHVVFGRDPSTNGSAAVGVRVVDFDSTAASYVGFQVQPETPPSVDPATGGSSGSMTSIQGQVYQTNDRTKFVYAFNANRPVYNQTWGNGVTSGADVTTDEFYGYHIYSADKSKSKRNIAFRSAFNQQTLPAVGEVGEEGYVPAFSYDNWNIYCDGTAANYFKGDIQTSRIVGATALASDASIALGADCQILVGATQSYGLRIRADGNVAVGGLGGSTSRFSVQGTVGGADVYGANIIPDFNHNATISVANAIQVNPKFSSDVTQAFLYTNAKLTTTDKVGKLTAFNYTIDYNDPAAKEATSENRAFATNLRKAEGKDNWAIIASGDAPSFFAGDVRSPAGSNPANDDSLVTKKYTDSRIWKGTQSAYDGLSEYDDDILYCITG